MDQATDLRRLVRRDATSTRASSGSRPRLIAVGSGKGGTGTTTVAVNLAVALAQAGHSTILVDADFNGADVARVCRLNDTYSLTHVLVGRRTVHEVLCRGPGGLLVIPGVWAPDRLAECSPQAQERLLSSLRDLGDYARYIVLDIGSGLNRVVRRFWHAADRLLLVTTPENTAVMNSYAAIKVLCDGDPHLPLSLVTNQASPREAEDVHTRVSQACRRFLGIQLACEGALPVTAQVRAAEASGMPCVLHVPDSDIARCFEQMAQSVTHGLSGQISARKAADDTCAADLVLKQNPQYQNRRAIEAVS